MNVERRQAAADPRPSQTTQAVSPPVQAARIYTHRRREAGVLAKPAVSTWTLISIYLAIFVVVVRS